jgi:hypothetical protein
MSNRANWYQQLCEMNEKEPIEWVCAETTPRQCDYEETMMKKLAGTLEQVRPVLDYEFDAGFGGEEGCYFTAWTKDRVLFPCCYDGSEWISSVPRNPCDVATRHKGGG